MSQSKQSKFADEVTAKTPSKRLLIIVDWISPNISITFSPNWYFRCFIPWRVTPSTTDFYSHGSIVIHASQNLFMTFDKECRACNHSEVNHFASPALSTSLDDQRKWKSVGRLKLVACGDLFCLGKRKSKARPWGSLILLNLSLKREYQQWIKRFADPHKDKTTERSGSYRVRCQNQDVCINSLTRWKNWQRTKFLI